MRPAAAIALLAPFVVAATGVESPAYFNNDRWVVTATNDILGPRGTAATLTWGIAADGTLVEDVLPGVDRTSNLIARLDGWFGAGPGGADLTQRPWFGYLQSSFERWGELSGLRFVYEPADDGVAHNVGPGILGVRADIRLAGARYDGTVGGNLGTTAYAIAPDRGDVFLDTDDVGYFSNPANSAFSLRHTLMHEIGHSLGLGHITSGNAAILMEPFPQTAFDGPQLDDIRGVQFLYGDRFEVAGGNETAATATALGTIAGGSTATVGANGGSLVVVPGELDFVGINRSADVDVFSFGVSSASDIRITMTPLGPTYSQTAEGGAFSTINAAQVGNLAVELRRAGVSLAVSASGGPGVAETIDFTTASADAFTVHVTGVTTQTQLYRLDIHVNDVVIAGDYNGDGIVDAADYTVWRDTLGSTQQLVADGDENGVIDSGDYGVWAEAYATPSPPAVATPETGGLAIALLLLSQILFSRKAVGVG